MLLHVGVCVFKCVGVSWRVMVGVGVGDGVPVSGRGLCVWCWVRVACAVVRCRRSKVEGINVGPRCMLP